MKRPLAALLLATLLGFGLLACGLVAPNTSSPRAGQAAPDGGRAGAPKVTNPRTFAGRDQDPCRALLTSEQLAQLGVRPSTSMLTRLPSGTPNCRWGQVPEGRLVNVAAYSQRDLLVDTYRTRPLPLFAPMSIEGLPAVSQQSSPSSVTCTVTTGIAEGQALDVSVDLFEGSDAARRSCGEAVAVSAAVISNLPPAA